MTSAARACCGRGRRPADRRRRLEQAVGEVELEQHGRRRHARTLAAPGRTSKNFPLIPAGPSESAHETLHGVAGPR